ncbi:MAG: thioesterase family protein [Actinobacteria bacterium]|nr:thioesterase family protein [Actinomycetota bacterium]
MSAFDQATAVHHTQDGLFDWSVLDGWQQGRGAWGGLVVGAIVKAVVAAEPDARRLVRSISAQLMAPAVVGAHRITVSPVRQGSAMSTWGIDVEGEGTGVVARAVVITGRGRTNDTKDHHTWGTLTRPDAPLAAEVPRLPSGPPFPVFLQHCDVRPITGLPMSGGSAETLGWSGYADPVPVTAASLLALVDAWWPASLPLLSQMPRIATVDFTASLLIDPATVAIDELLLHHSFVSGAHDGFTSEQRRLWTSDGRLVVDNMQTIVVGS